MTKEVKGVTSNVAETIRMDDPLPLKIGYIGGGSRGWFPALVRDLARCPWFTGEVRLYDIDYDAASFNAGFGNWIQGHPDNKSKWKYRAYKSLKSALTDVDFVFISIQPGPIQTMKWDLELPMRYGIFQPVGDTVGPGGTVRGFRSARIYQTFADSIEQYCPSAWVFNFTNPMSVCTRTLHKIFPGIKAFGCCHEVFGTQGFLGGLYAKKFKTEVPRREEIRVNVMGINHFTWIDRAECRGTDMMELVREHLKTAAATRLYTPVQAKQAMARMVKKSGKEGAYFMSTHRVAFELTRRFGPLAAAGDRHLAEFVPWFLKDKTSCLKWGFNLTPYTYRKERWKTAPRQMQRYLSGKEPFVLSDSGEEYMNQLAALCGLAEFRTNVNLPNQGQVERLPDDAIVETNALFSQNAVESVTSGRLPPAVESMVRTHITNQENIVEATLSGDKDLGFHAFINDPLCSMLQLDQAWKLFNQMLVATKFRF